MKHPYIKEILEFLDTAYGTDKDGFLHHEPWQLLCAIMLSAQSTDKQVDAVLPALFDRYRKVEDMADAKIEEIESLIQTIGLHHSKAKNMKHCCCQIVTQHAGLTPDTMQALTSLAGVGRKTANLFLADAYGIPGITVDTHVKRIAGRLGLSSGDDAVRVEFQLREELPQSHWIRINIQMIRHGRAICKARNPRCSKCGMNTYCLYSALLDWQDTRKSFNPPPSFC